jgi:hypothetical protein
MHPFEKYNVTIGDDVVVSYATGDGSINAFAGEIGNSPKDEDLLLFLDDNAAVLIAHSAIVGIHKTEDMAGTRSLALTPEEVRYLKRKMFVELPEDEASGLHAKLERIELEEEAV